VKTSLVILAASTTGLAFTAAFVSWNLFLRQPRFKPSVIQSGSTPVRKGLAITEEYRKVYPYSVVPGGAQTVAEARRAMSDPSVRSHYAAVDLNNLKITILSSDLSGYVSYRYGDKIYWTAKTVRLKAGETVFTDGQHIVRGRCLNSYSAHPMAPIRPHEPEEKVMETWVEIPVLAFSFPALPLPGEPVLSAPAKPTMAAAPRPQKGTTRRFFPIIPIIPPIFGHPRHSPPPDTPPFPPPPTPPPTTVVPEPSYTAMLAVVLFVLPLARWVLRRRYSRNNSITQID
jgi:hypothetical protein